MNESLSLYADVILPLPVAGCFTYTIPPDLTNMVLPGCRVIVQFGTKKFYSGLVREVHNREPESYKAKYIEYLLDTQPVIPVECIEFWDWIAGYYHCTIGEVLKAALPSGLKLESETRIIYNPDYIEQTDDRLTPKEQLLLDVISQKKELSVSELNNSVLSKNTILVLKDLLRKNAVRVSEDIKDSYRAKTVILITLSPRLSSKKKISLAVDSLKKVPKQEEMLLAYLNQSGILEKKNGKEITKKEFLASNHFSIAVLNGLIKKDILSVIEKPVDRLPDYEGAIQQIVDLSPIQSIAWQQIKQSFESKPVTLLHGVTSSGKTEIYINLIKEYTDKGKQVLYLLPEIGLTTQMISRLTKVFGNKVGVYHSGFNDRERVEIWHKVMNFRNNADDNIKSYQLVVGARSSIFLPFHDLGLIIVDEEHDTSYKQFDPAPRYHARDVAIVLGHLKKAPVLLGTATPSVESYYNAKTGKYGLIELNERHLNIEMPNIVIADLKDAYKRKQMKMHLTPLLFEEINKALENKEQVILFQNRRGFSPFVECKTCAWIPKCRHCDVSLTYHKYNNTLQCHYCGYSEINPDHCPSCGSKSVMTKGFGTEKVEEDLMSLFPEAVIERIDLDTTRSKKGFEKIITSFDNGTIDILVGTQMITKGLDFNNVSVVGILNADNLLNQPDFRAYERSYQLMAQVSGRAGRKYKQGKVIIQTSEPSHHIIQNVLNNDYTSMFRGQIAERQQFKYPPFYRLVSIIFRHREKADLDRISDELAAELRSRFGLRILGPEYPVINRIKGLYIKQLWLKFEREASVVNAKRQMQEIIDKVKSRSGNKTIQIAVDVDPL